MAKKELITPQQILTDIKNRKFAPVYFLMGDESYYIDLITNALLDTVLTEEEKDFNLTVFYGADTEIGNVISVAKRYPMMAEYQLVVLKEAQLVDNLDRLELYMRQPLSSTILVINYKHKSYDSRKKLMKDVASAGVIFESKRIYDDKVPGFVQNYVSSKGGTIDAKAALMISDFVGSDLNRLCSELDKLVIALNGEKRITPELVERNVGISKDYNNFELLRAVISRDIYKASLIQKYFAKDPKDNPLVVTISVLFNFFANLMLVYYSPDKSPEGIARELGLKGTYFTKDYLQAARIYNAFKTMEVISLLREYDAKAKGFNYRAQNDGDVLKELLYKIMH